MFYETSIMGSHRNKVIIFAMASIAMLCGCSQSSTIERRYSKAFAAGEYEKARLYAERLAVKSKSKTSELSDDYAGALNKLALAEQNLGNLEDAESHHEAALRIYELLHGRNSESVGTTLSYLAQLYLRQGRTDWAILTMQQALTVYMASPATPEFLIASRINSLAVMYQTAGRTSQAKGLMLKSTQMFRDCVGTGHPAFIAASNNLRKLNLQIEMQQAR